MSPAFCGLVFFQFELHLTFQPSSAEVAGTILHGRNNLSDLEVAYDGNSNKVSARAASQTHLPTIPERTMAILHRQP